MSLEKVKAVFFDLSGVLYIGTQAMDGAVKTIDRLRAEGYILRFVTNTSSHSYQMVKNQLNTLGFDFKTEELFTAPQAAKLYIQRRNLRPFCIIHDNLKPEFADIDQSNPNCVLLADAQNNLNYQNLNQAFIMIEQGFPLIGMGKNKYYKDAESFKLDVGSFIHALEWASGTQATIVGKPDAQFFQTVVDTTGLKNDECLMIGDDVLGDVQGAINAGLQGCLVKTGKFKADDLNRLPKQAYVIDIINQLPDLLAQFKATR